MAENQHNQLNSFSWLQLKLLKAGWEVQFDETNLALEKSLKGLVTPVKGATTTFSQSGSESGLDTPPQPEAMSKIGTSDDIYLMLYGYTLRKPNTIPGHYTPLVDICNKFKGRLRLNSFTLRHDLGTEVRPGSGLSLLAHCYRAQLTLADSPDVDHAIIIVLEDLESPTKWEVNNILAFIQLFDYERMYILFFRGTNYNTWVYCPRRYKPRIFKSKEDYGC